MSVFLRCSQLIGLLCFLNNCFAQKPSLDFAALKNWPEIQSPSLSNDGNYVMYFLNGKVDCGLYIKSVNNSFNKIITNLPNGFYNAKFTEDSRNVVLLRPENALNIIELPSGKETNIDHCQSFKLPEGGNGEWLVWLSDSSQLSLYNLSSGQKKIFERVTDFQFSTTGKILLVIQAGSDGKTFSLSCVNILDETSKNIWNGSGTCSQYVFNKTETKLAFVTEETVNDRAEKVIYGYEHGQPTALKLVGANTNGLDAGMVVNSSGELKFSLDDDKLFFSVQRLPAIQDKKPGTASVDVWNYKDDYVQEQQLKNINRIASYPSVISLKEKKIIILGKDGDDYLTKINEANNSNELLVTRQVGKPEGIYLLPQDLNIVNTKNGSRECILKKGLHDFLNFSTEGKYVYWYDRERTAYYTYDVREKVIKNITKGVKYPLYYEEYSATMKNPYAYQPAPLWLENDKGVLIYDRYDIWLVDPSANSSPINITHGFGRKNKIQLRCIYDDNTGDKLAFTKIKSDATIILCGFNEVNKSNGFFKLKIGSDHEPKELVMSSARYYFPTGGYPPRIPGFLKKARDKEVYLLFKESATEFPNLLITKNFKDFLPISDLSPQKEFNWLTRELLHWATFNGKPGTGILYKPENFNPKNKYPVVLYFYEQLSNELNRFPVPELATGQMNIAYFVSQGYLVFCPDIYYTLGKTGESAYNYIASAATMLEKKPWIDATRMGIQGHSFGGYEVNYVVTRTGMFAAAASAAGVSDLISLSGTLGNDGQEGQYAVEKAQSRMKVSLWDDKAGYIQNSPVFAANKVMTPLLIMHNKTDMQVPWGQGVEFFTALRHLGKKSWMLQYDQPGNGHGIYNNVIGQLDYTIRLQQFFDHYLKGAPAPKWMTQGIPAKLKQIQQGYEFDPAGDCGKECKICKEWNNKWKKDSIITMNEIEKKLKTEHWMAGVQAKEKLANGSSISSK